MKTIDKKNVKYSIVANLYRVLNYEYIIFCSGFKSLAILILVLLYMFENAKHQKRLKTLTILDKLDLGY